MRSIPNLVGKIAVLLIPIACFAQSASDPSVGCQYLKDSDPKQISGMQQDNDYHFTYVSDYERTDQTYRRRICNQGQQKVWFDWELTALTGTAAAGGKIENELPYPDEPEVNEGRLKYDFREMNTRGYKYKPTKPSKGGAPLHSFLSGFMTKGDEVVPARVEVNSSIGDNKYSYEIVNDSAVPVEFIWNDFVVFWSHHGNQYGPQFEEMVKKGLLAKDSNWKDLILTAGAKIQWTFVEKDGMPQQRISTLRLFSRGSHPNYERPDLAGLVSMYLPPEETNVAIGK